MPPRDTANGQPPNGAESDQGQGLSTRANTPVSGAFISLELEDSSESGSGGRRKEYEYNAVSAGDLSSSFSEDDLNLEQFGEEYQRKIDEINRLREENDNLKAQLESLRSGAELEGYGTGWASGPFFTSTPKKPRRRAADSGAADHNAETAEENQRLREQLAELEMELASQQQRLNSVNASVAQAGDEEVDNLTQKIAEQERLLRKLNQEIERLRRSEEQTRQEKNSALDTNVQLAEERNQALMKVRDITLEKAELQRNFGEVSQVRDAALAAVDKLTQKNIEHLQDLAIQRSQMSDLIVEHRNQLESQQTAFEKAMRVSEAQKDQEIQAVTDRYKEVEKELSELRAKESANPKSSDSDLVAHFSPTVTRPQTPPEQRTESRALEVQLVALREEIDKLNREKKRLTKEGADRDTLFSERGRLIEERNALQTQMDLLNKRVLDAEASERIKDEEVRRIRGQLGVKDQEITNLKRLLGEQTDTIQRLTAENERITATLQQNALQIQRLETHNAELLEANTRVMQEMALSGIGNKDLWRSVEAKNKEITDLTQRNAGLQDELDEVRRRQEVLQREIADADKRGRTAEDKARHAEERTAALELADREREAELKRNRDDIQANRDQIASLQAENDSLRNAQADLDGQKRAVSDQIAAAQDAARAANKEKQRMAAELTAKNAELTAVQSQLQQAQDEIARAQAAEKAAIEEQERVVTEAEEERSRFDQHAREMQTREVAQQEQIRGLQSHNADLNQLAAELRAQNEALQGEINLLRQKFGDKAEGSQQRPRRVNSLSKTDSFNYWPIASESSAEEDEQDEEKGDWRGVTRALKRGVQHDPDGISETSDKGLHSYTSSKASSEASSGLASERSDADFDDEEELDQEHHQHWASFDDALTAISEDIFVKTNTPPENLKDWRPGAPGLTMADNERKITAGQKRKVAISLFTALAKIAQHRDLNKTTSTPALIADIFRPLKQGDKPIIVPTDQDYTQAKKNLILDNAERNALVRFMVEIQPDITGGVEKEAWLKQNCGNNLIDLSKQNQLRHVFARIITLLIGERKNEIFTWANGNKDNFNKTIFGQKSGIGRSDKSHTDSGRASALSESYSKRPKSVFEPKGGAYQLTVDQRIEAMKMQ